MKAILISIKPKYVANILNGKKTIEIRKTMPKCDLPIDVYIYCTKKSKNYLYKDYYEKITHEKVFVSDEKPLIKISQLLNGKVVAKFTLNNVEEIKCHCLTKTNAYGVQNIVVQNATKTLSSSQLSKKSCLTNDEINDYLEWVDDNNVCGYAWHISNLEIFDKPKELSEFRHWVFYKKCDKCPYGKCDYDYGLCSQCCEIKPLTKAPQSWEYCEL